jgi:pSer/pThr/pTyr-binding forkhead associated (FHA) protein
MPRTYLVVRVKDHADPIVYPLEGEEITVGRSTANAIVVIEPEMSRTHFQLTLEPTGYTIHDLNSTNGTMLNGEPLTTTPRPLYMEDVISVGMAIRFELSDSGEQYRTLTKTDRLVTPEIDEPTEVRRATSRAEIERVIQATTTEPASGLGSGLEVGSLEKHILVAYGREDWEPVVAPLLTYLYDAGIPMWVDQYLNVGSADWQAALDQARLECPLLIIVLSPAAMQSEEVRRTWRHFHNREKPILVLQYRPVERLPLGVKKLPHVHYNTSLPEASYRLIVSKVQELLDE